MRLKRAFVMIKATSSLSVHPKQSPSSTLSSIKPLPPQKKKRKQQQQQKTTHTHKNHLRKSTNLFVKASRSGKSHSHAINDVTDIVVAEWLSAERDELMRCEQGTERVACVRPPRRIRRDNPGPIEKATSGHALIKDGYLWSHFTRATSKDRFDPASKKRAREKREKPR